MDAHEPTPIPTTAADRSAEAPRTADPPTPSHVREPAPEPGPGSDPAPDPALTSPPAAVPSAFVDAPPPGPSASVPVVAGTEVIAGEAPMAAASPAVASPPPVRAAPVGSDPASASGSGRLGGAGPVASSASGRPWRERFAGWQSRMLGELAEWSVTRTGGECATVGGLRVCREGRLRLHAGGGTQLGDVFVSPVDPARLRGSLIAHETHHRDAQWRRYGWVFGVMYLWAHLLDVVVRHECCNRYELAAERASGGGGGYGCLDGG